MNYVLLKKIAFIYTKYYYFHSFCNNMNIYAVDWTTEIAQKYLSILTNYFSKSHSLCRWRQMQFTLIVMIIIHDRTLFPNTFYMNYVLHIPKNSTHPPNYITQWSIYGHPPIHPSHLKNIATRVAKVRLAKIRNNFTSQFVYIKTFVQPAKTSVVFFSLESASPNNIYIFQTTCPQRTHFSFHPNIHHITSSSNIRRALYWYMTVWC